MKPLTPRQRRFVEYVSCYMLNKAAAYRKAGYSAKGAKVGAFRLWRKPAVQEYRQYLIDETTKLIEERAENRRKLIEQLKNDTAKNVNFC